MALRDTVLPNSPPVIAQVIRHVLLKEVLYLWRIQRKEREAHVEKLVD